MLYTPKGSWWTIAAFPKRPVGFTEPMIGPGLVASPKRNESNKTRYPKRIRPQLKTLKDLSWQTLPWWVMWHPPADTVTLYEPFWTVASQSGSAVRSYADPSANGTTVLGLSIFFCMCWNCWATCCWCCICCDCCCCMFCSSVCNLVSKAATAVCESRPGGDWHGDISVCQTSIYVCHVISQFSYQPKLPTNQTGSIGRRMLQAERALLRGKLRGNIGCPWICFKKCFLFSVGLPDLPLGWRRMAIVFADAKTSLPDLGCTFLAGRADMMTSPWVMLYTSHGGDTMHVLPTECQHHRDVRPFRLGRTGGPSSIAQTHEWAHLLWHQTERGQPQIAWHSVYRDMALLIYAICGHLLLFLHQPSNHIGSPCLAKKTCRLDDCMAAVVDALSSFSQMTRCLITWRTTIQWNEVPT